MIGELQEAMTAAASKRREEWDKAEGRFNILVAGNTGAGKSTLVNAFFGVELADVGSGRPVTQGLERHTLPGHPVAIYDTRGFETGGAIAVDNCKKDIAELRGQEREEDQLHVAWLCVDQSTGRFEDAHEDFVGFLNDNSLPTIVVVTRSLDDPGPFEEKLASALPKGVPVLNVIAKDIRSRAGVIPAEGLEALFEETLRLVPFGRRAALIAAQAVSWKRKDGEAARLVRKYAGLAGGTALSPVPGSQLVALAAIQGKMMMDLDLVAGAATSSVMHYAKLAALAAARTGGLKLFELGMAQALKFLPAIGTAAGTALGMGVAATVTGGLGRAYWEATKLSVRSGKTVDEATFADLYEREKDRKDEEPPAVAA